MSRLGTRFVLVCATMAAMPLAVTAADRSLADVLAKMDEAAAKFKGLSADMVHVQHMDAIHEDDTDSGSILVKRPKPKDLHVKIEYKKPEPKVVYSDGSRVDIYYPHSGQVEPYDLGKRRSMVDMILALGFGGTSRDLQNAYGVKLGGEETVAGESATRLELTPKAPELLSETRRIDLWISNKTGHTVQQKFFENGKDYELITYTNIQPNPEIPDSAFKPPKGSVPKK